MNKGMRKDQQKQVVQKRTKVLKIRLSEAEERQINSTSTRACVASWARDVLLATDITKPRSRKGHESEDILVPLTRFSDEELKQIGQLTAVLSCLNAAIWEHEFCDHDVLILRLINIISVFLRNRLYINDN